MPVMDLLAATVDRSRRRRLGPGASLVGALLLAGSSDAWACPSCSAAIAKDPVAAAFSWTTLLLIAMPLVLLGSIGGWVALAYWRAARADAVLNRGASVPPSSWVHLWAEKERET